MNRFAILRTKKLKTAAQLSAAGSHNSRSRETPNAHPEKPFGLVAGGNDPLEKFNQVIEQHGIRVRKNAVMAIEYLVSFSPEVKSSLDLEKWAKDNLGFFELKHGKEAILSAHLHLDESTPHMHIVCAPLVKKGQKMKLCARDFLGGKAKLQKLQTDYARAMSEHGLERGIKGSKAHHKKVSHLYGQLNSDFEKLKKRVNQEVEKLPEPSLINFKETFKHLKKQIKSLVKKVAVQAGKIEALTERNRELERGMAKLRSWVKSTDLYKITQEHKEVTLSLEARLEARISKITQERDALRETLITSEKRFQAAENVLKQRNHNDLDYSR